MRKLNVKALSWTILVIIYIASIPLWIGMNMLWAGILFYAISSGLGLYGLFLIGQLLFEVIYPKVDDNDEP